jgi:hypothetical protein
MEKVRGQKLMKFVCCPDFKDVYQRARPALQLYEAFYNDDSAIKQIWENEIKDAFENAKWEGPVILKN